MDEFYHVQKSDRREKLNCRRDEDGEEVSWLKEVCPSYGA